MSNNIFKHINEYCKELEKEFSNIPNQRKEDLNVLSQYIDRKFKEDKTPNLTVICTHNSRRSHFGQIWLAVGADYYELPKIETYSGGTEATAFNPRAVAAISRVGFDVVTLGKQDENPRYLIKWIETMIPYQAYSTKYDEEPSPSRDFGAIMVCTDADEKCPIITGADFRLSLPYEDPKAFDETPLEAEKYDERCRQIGSEMLFVLSQIRT